MKYELMTPALAAEFAAKVELDNWEAVIAPTKGTRRPADRRSRRRETALYKANRRRMAEYANDWINPVNGKVFDTGLAAYSRGDKVYTRKTRHEAKAAIRMEVMS